MIRMYNSKIKNHALIFDEFSLLSGKNLTEDVARGFFERVSSDYDKDVWDSLMSQESLSTLTIDKNLLLGQEAWMAGGKKLSPDESPHFDNKLCDNALRCWVAAFLLGEPMLRRSDSAFG